MFVCVCVCRDECIFSSKFRSSFTLLLNGSERDPSQRYIIWFANVSSAVILAMACALQINFDVYRNVRQYTHQMERIIRYFGRFCTVVINTSRANTHLLFEFSRQRNDCKWLFFLSFSLFSFYIHILFQLKLSTLCHILKSTGLIQSTSLNRFARLYFIWSS